MQQEYNEVDSQKFYAGNMTKDELIAFSDYLMSCDDCSLHFAELEESAKAILPPAGFSESVLSTVKLKNRTEFLKYCAKVSAAACFALTVLFSEIPGTLYDVSSKVVEEEFVNQTSVKLEEFKNKIFFKEDEQIDKTQ